MNIGERLKIVRDLYGYSQDKVAKGIGIKSGTYQSYERDRAEAPLRVLLALSEYYGYYSLDLLLGRMVQAEYCETVLNKYLLASPEKRKIIDFILSLKN